MATRCIHCDKSQGGCIECGGHIYESPATTAFGFVQIPDSVSLTLSSVSRVELQRLHIIDHKRCFFLCDDCLEDIWPRWFGTAAERPPANGDPWRWWEHCCRYIVQEQWGWEDKVEGPWMNPPVPSTPVHRHRPY